MIRKGKEKLIVANEKINSVSNNDCLNRLHGVRYWSSPLNHRSSVDTFISIQQQQIQTLL
jgi:hypothetical protein